MTKNTHRQYVYYFGDSDFGFVSSFEFRVSSFALARFRVKSYPGIHARRFGLTLRRSFTNRTINTIDVFLVLPPIYGSTTGGTNYSLRADLVPDGAINTLDVFKVLPPIYGSGCS